MPPPEKPLSPDVDQPSIDEARMRRALGLDRPPAVPSAQSAQPRPAQPRPEQVRPEQARARHRFVRDGEVPVVVVNGHGTSEAAPNGQAAGMQAKLLAERQARADAERALAEAQVTVRSLQAKLAHAELAHAEARAAERRAREAAETALQQVLATREPAERYPRAATPAREIDAPTTEPASAKAKTAKPAREPQPVKWWVPGYKAKAKGR